MSNTFFYGFHAVSSLLKHRPSAIKKIFWAKDPQSNKSWKELFALIEKQRIQIETLSSSEMNQRFKDQVHQGLVAQAEPLPTYQEQDIPALLAASTGPALILILDEVTDPHNLGACFRLADATGVDFILIPKDKAVGITGVVSKVASGAAETIPLVRATNLARAMERLKAEGVWIYGADGEAGASIYEMNFKTSTALVLGSEGKGLRRLTRETCDGLFSLPMLGSVSSLNVSTASAVSLYEVLRQRQYGSLS